MCLEYRYGNSDEEAAFNKVIRHLLNDDDSKVTRSKSIMRSVWQKIQIFSQSQSLSKIKMHKENLGFQKHTILDQDKTWSLKKL